MAAEASNDSDDYGMDWASTPIQPQLPLTAGGTSSPATPDLPSSGPPVTTTAPEPVHLAIIDIPPREEPVREDVVKIGLSTTPISATASTSTSATSSAYSLALSSNLPPMTGLGPNLWHAKSSNRKRHAAEFSKMARPPK